jgi:hypothetical protein
MAESSQHALQIMETQTCFDLNAAIEKWRQELAAQPNLAVPDQRELETHLRDTLAELQQRGLNDEESFWLARRRVGQPQQLDEEFAKDNPKNVWRERLFWVAAAFFAMRLWSGIAMVTIGISLYYLHDTAWANASLQLFQFAPDWVRFYLPLSSIQVSRILTSMILQNLVCYAPLVWLAVSLAGGRAEKVSSLLRFVFKSRQRFLLLAGAFLAFQSAYQSACVSLLVKWLAVRAPTAKVAFGPVGDSVYFGWLLPIFLAALIAWLMPRENRKTPEGA